MQIKIRKPAQLSNQQLEIYLLLKERKEQGVTSWEMTNERPDGLQIIDYRRRISDLRSFGYQIVNVHKNLYKLNTEPRMDALDVAFILREAERRKYQSLISRCRMYQQDLRFAQSAREALL
jgi:hypothetical protein